MTEYLSFRIGAPSWVKAGTVADNARFLAGRVDEVELCFYERTSSLAYGYADLPPSLKTLPLAWHVHLPFDLFANGAEDAIRDGLALMEKIDAFGARQAVFHPPRETRVLLRFLEAWEQSGRRREDALAENTPDAPLSRVLELARETGCGLCPDLGHTLQEWRACNEPEAIVSAWERALALSPLIHLNAVIPGQGSRHAPLTALACEEQVFLARMFECLESGRLFVFELFSWPQIEASLVFLKNMARNFAAEKKTREIAR